MRVSYDPTIYRGSAPHYAVGRPPYSPGLEAVLAEAVGLDGRGRLLDVGCGPGVLALRLAHLFEAGVGLDPDPDMLTEAGRRAAEQGISNVCWVQALAEDLPGTALGPYRLVTFGQSFHRTAEHEVAEVVYDLLDPGGALALIVHSVSGRPAPASPGYLGPIPRSGRGYVQPRDHTFEDVLVRTRFGEPITLWAPGIPDLVRDTESVLSGYFSMTTSAPHLFGDRIDEFASEARALLRQRSPKGLFWDWPGDTAIVLACRPADD
jgi:SAM-dependent methyltransferase